MAEVIVLESTESSDSSLSDISSDGGSIVEVEVPERTPPPVIDIEEEEEDLVIHVKQIHNKVTEKFQMTENLNDLQPAKKSSHEGHPSHWTPDMIQFYDDEWGDEESFDVSELQDKMDKHPLLWEISKKDRLMEVDRKKSRVKCWNCMQVGHPSYMCKDPVKVRVCHMCGYPGHNNFNCPESKCLNCGNQTRGYCNSCSKCSNLSNSLCQRCNLRGHSLIDCSDIWRSFHLTTGNTMVDKNELLKIPEKCVNKRPEQIWCCNCAKKGHFSLLCKDHKNLPFYPERSPFVWQYRSEYKLKDTYLEPSSTPQSSSSKQVSSPRHTSKEPPRKRPKQLRYFEADVPDTPNQVGPKHGVPKADVPTSDLRGHNSNQNFNKTFEIDHQSSKDDHKKNKRKHVGVAKFETVIGKWGQFFDQKKNVNIGTPNRQQVDSSENKKNNQNRTNHERRHTKQKNGKNERKYDRLRPNPFAQHAGTPQKMNTNQPQKSKRANNQDLNSKIWKAIIKSRKRNKKS